MSFSADIDPSPRSPEETQQFAPHCPICGSESVRDPGRVGALDCQCMRCGWYHTSPLRRTVLNVLANRKPGKHWP